MEQSNAVLTQAANLIKAGQKKEAVSLLRQLLQAEPGNVRAWGILSMAVDDVEERREALQAVARFGDDRMSTWARQQLAAMPPPPPPPVMDFELPAAPPLSQTAAEPSNPLMDFEIPAAQPIQSTPSNRPASSARPYLIAGGAILAVACLLLVVVLMLPTIQSYLEAAKPTQMPPTAVPTATVAVTRRPRPTPTITNTPLPTKTRVPRATKTPTPTQTETPTPGPSPTATKIPTSVSGPIPTQTTQLTVQAYGLALAQPMPDMGVALEDLGDLINKKLDERSLLFDSAWRASVDSDVAIVQLNYRKLAELNPPPDLADMHGTLIDGAHDCNDAMDHIITGINANNPNEFSLADTLLESCSDKVSTANEKLVDYISTH